MEDKKCRICGLADMANASIPNLNSKLIEKIVAVFPIIMYPNDPLPKHICRKCLYNTTTMYVEIEKAIRNQNKWIANVRAVQPDNHYVKVVDSIEGANKQTSLLVSKVAGEELGHRTVCHMFNLKNDETHLHSKVKNEVTPVAASVINRTTSAPDPMEINADITAPVNAEQMSPPRQNTEESVQSLLSNTPAKITQLKSALELNGCTLTKVNHTIRAPNEVVELTNIPLIKVEIKEEPQFEEQTTEYSIQCKMCLYRCETVEELAIHQLDHLSISLPKLCERKYLEKRTRRGRLIRIDEKKCIRCLNCWRIFVDNKSILHHWSTGDCDFFCTICGKEFASSPKMLREHVPAAHGISYRSVKLLRPPTMMLKKSLKKENAHKPEPSSGKGAKGSVSSEALSVRVACNICLKVFANFKARNSHMRAHKNPPQLPAQPPPSLSDTLMAFNRSKLMPMKQEIQDYDDIPYHIVKPIAGPTPSTSRVVTANIAPKPQTQQLHLPSKVIQTRPLTNPEGRTSSPAGIRTKYVQIRPILNSVISKNDPGNGATVLKVKSLVDLQDPSVSSQQPEDSDKAGLRAINAVGPVANSLPTTNGLGAAPALPKDNMNYGQIFNCHPCGGKFSSKLELFRHKRKCTANNLFPCQFCSRHFLTSADLQMHIMLLHKSSTAQ